MTKIAVVNEVSACNKNQDILNALREIKDIQVFKPFMDLLMIESNRIQDIKNIIKELDK